MKAFTADKIRNILLAGHGGSGKTALAEAMLFKSGLTERMGSTNEGSTVCDFDPEEIRRKISINSALASTTWQDTKINIIDAPGQFDFIGGMYEGIRAAESVIITVNGKDGVCPGTIKAYNLAAGQNKARMLAVTCMEVENSDFYKVHTQLKTVFGPSVCPIVVPYDKNGPVEAYINLLTMKAYKYDNKGIPTEVPMPASENRIAGLRASMAEAVAETNEEFMEKFFSGEEFTHDELVKGIHDGVASGAITPLVCCANDTLSGVDMLLDAVVSMLPSPNERKLEMLDGAVLDYDENKPLKAFVFKTVADPFVGKISVIKVIQGKLTAGVSAVNATTGESLRFGKLLKLVGKKQEEVTEALAGDIVAVTKLEAATNDTICAPEAVSALAPTVFPEACYFRAVTLNGNGDEGKLSSAIRRLLEEDPTLKYIHNHETHQRIIGGLGEQHLDVAAAKLKAKFGMDVVMSEPKIAYREAIRKKVTIESKYKKQSGGHGQYGHVKIEFEPYDGEPLLFEEKIFGGSVPKNFFPAVEKGLQEAAEHGSVGGFPVVRLKATLIDGSYHPVDSSEMAFKTAASMAFKDCMKEAQPYLLEPVQSLKILLPDDKQGDVMSVLSKRRGSVLGMNSVGEGMTELTAEAPEAELSDFALVLRQITQGLGEFTAEFARYDMLPPGTDIKS
ncbi:MAG: elongation factor G [Oscillospiraceae bacterium]|nr:elongation factor G [Oscillospiraceae bacterium]